VDRREISERRGEHATKQVEHPAVVGPDAP
jgi:hypothetical protein